MKEIETVEQVYDRIAPNMSKAWGKKDVAMMVAKVYAAQFQPKWIKINSEDDLPKENDFYWVMVADGVFFVAEFVSHLRAFTMKGRYMDVLTATRYAPIIKPQPPKED